jgi:hypothetical protein
MPLSCPERFNACFSDNEIMRHRYPHAGAQLHCKTGPFCF